MFSSPGLHGVIAEVLSESAAPTVVSRNAGGVALFPEVLRGNLILAEGATPQTSRQNPHAVGRSGSGSLTALIPATEQGRRVKDPALPN